MGLGPPKPVRDQYHKPVRGQYHRNHPIWAGVGEYYYQGPRPKAGHPAGGIQPREARGVTITWYSLVSSQMAPRSRDSTMSTPEVLGVNLITKVF